MRTMRKPRVLRETRLAPLRALRTQVVTRTGVTES